MRVLRAILLICVCIAPLDAQAAGELPGGDDHATSVDSEVDVESQFGVTGVPKIKQVTPPQLLEISDEGGVFRIPYIQRSTTLEVSVKVANLPPNGGVEFILNDAATFDMASPFARTYTVTPGQHQLEIYLVDRDQNRLTNPEAHSGPQLIGIGSLTATIGDSITAGVEGAASSRVIRDCARSPSASLDCRNFFQHNVSDGDRYRGYQVRANDCLTSATGAAQFLMNEGVGGITSRGVLNRMDVYMNRIQQLGLEQVFLLIGTNDANQGVSPGQWQRNVESIIRKLKAAGINASDIYLGRVPYRDGTSAGAEASRQLMQEYNARIPAITANTGARIGPDFYAYFEAHTSQLADNLHPNQAGYDAMAGLWTQSVTGSSICAA